MNVESATVSSAKSSSSTSSSSSATATKESSASFKDELKNVKQQEVGATDAQEQNAQVEANSATEDQGLQNSQNNLSQQVSKEDLLTGRVEQIAANEELDVLNSLTELNTKIASINDLKSGSGKDSNRVEAKDELKNDIFTSMSMDNQDISFFLSLCQNEQMSAQASQIGVQSGSNQANFTEIKAEASSKTVQVSQAMLDALNESAKSGKSFRIDFDKDVSVIMRVDKDGALSANFIPGTAAVESYLKNNIAALRQTFEDKNIAYNELTYSDRRKDEQQQEKQQKQNNREKDNE